jgi:cation transport ATPase
MSVLLIACPCALGLATPLAVWTSLSTAVRNQVLFRSGEAVERLANVRAICLDKTGTLTTGQPHVCQTATFGERTDDQALQLAALLALSSSHPFSKAVAEYATRCSERSVSGAAPAAADRPALLSLRTVAGGGVEATTVNDQVVRLGSVEFACCSVHHDDTARQQPLQAAPSLCVACRAAVPLGLRVQMDRLRMAADQQTASIVLLSIDHIPAVGFLISESIRPEAREALLQLSGKVDILHVLSGDRPAKAKYLLDHLQVPGLQVECRLTPEQKVLRVAEVRRSLGTTVMVGDGINDAPALAASDVGIAMGCGADVSRDSAQICLLSNDLTRIPWAIDLARRTQAVIRQNLFWAFGYNGIGVCLAASGMLNPAVAAGLMILSSLLVISNSLRLLQDPPGHSGNPVPPDAPVSSEASESGNDTSDVGITAAKVQQPDGSDVLLKREPLVKAVSESCETSFAAEVLS